MTANSANYPHETLQLALRYIDSAPPDVQKSLIFALVKEITIHHDKIDIRMYLGAPDQILQTDIDDCDHNKAAVKNKNPAPELLRNGADVNEQALGFVCSSEVAPHAGLKALLV